MRQPSQGRAALRSLKAVLSALSSKKGAGPRGSDAFLTVTLDSARAVVRAVLLVAIAVVAVRVLLVLGQDPEDTLDDGVVACLDWYLNGAVLDIDQAQLAVRAVQDPVRKGERAHGQQTGSGGRHHDSSLLQHCDSPVHI